MTDLGDRLPGQLVRSAPEWAQAEAPGLERESRIAGWIMLTCAALFTLAVAAGSYLVGLGAGTAVCK